VAGPALLRRTSVARFSFFRAAARPGFVFFCRRGYALALMRHLTAHVELVRRGSFGTKLSPLAGIFSQHPHPRVRPPHDELRPVLREADVLGPSSLRHATQLPARASFGTRSPRGGRRDPKRGNPAIHTAFLKLRDRDSNRGPCGAAIPALEPNCADLQG
jgi:hypothetical protein